MNSPSDYALHPVGIVRSPLKRLEDCPLQESEDAPAAAIEISQEFRKGIRNIKVGDRLILLTWLHASDRSVIECFPRRNYDAPIVGVFSTRSPDRPNPIGLHSVTVTAVENSLIKVLSLEVLDGTPIVDIKPAL